MMTDPTFDEVNSTIEEVNIGKAPRGDNIATTVYTFILGIWRGDPVPQDWVDAIMRVSP